MDKNTLSNYGWIVIAVLVLSVMIALATPFGQYIESGVRSTTEGLFSTSQNAMNSAFNAMGVEVKDPTFEEGYQGGQSTPTIDMSTVSSTLEENDWATISAVVKAGKAEEAGWKVGDTKTLTINEISFNSNNEIEFTTSTKTATIIGLNHNGDNTATFMILESIGWCYVNPTYTNDGGWENCDIRYILNNNIYNSMDMKEYIIPTQVISNNIGFISSPNASMLSIVTDNLFLISAKESNATNDGVEEIYSNEGTEYEYFLNNNIGSGDFWFRTPSVSCNDGWHQYHYGMDGTGADGYCGICPLFVIG